MAMKRSMTRNKNHDDASSTNSICDPWSDLTHDVLFLVMMQLGVVDFLAFSRVCKSWRSLAISNKKKFIVSRPPMSVSISTTDANENEFYFEDFEGRKLKTILPAEYHSADRICIGVTCGYLILYGKETNDFWLVNPITRHGLHFPFPDDSIEALDIGYKVIRAILVFSPSISGWVFVVLCRCYSKIWFCIPGKQDWTSISIRFHIHDLHAFRGKIYTLHSVYLSDQVRLCEMRLYPEPKLVLLETESYHKPDFTFPGFVSSGEKLYVMDWMSKHPYKIHEIDLDKMKMVSHEKKGKEYAFFLSHHIRKPGLAVIQAWVGTRSLYRKYVVTDESEKGKFFNPYMWYVFHDCLNVDLLHE